MASASTSSPFQPVPTAPPLSALPESSPEPSTRLLLGVLLVAALLPRLLLFPVNENLYGDAVVRTELAERWLNDPHLIKSYQDGAYQFGPLHVYLVGGALTVLGREDAGRAVSLLFGVLSVVPLFLLTRRLFGWRAGMAAGLAFSVWGMHLQFSTTAGSEAVSLFLMLWVLSLFAEGLDENRFAPLFWSAMVLNLACATRYDAWLFMPLLTLAPLVAPEDRVAAITRSFGFGLLCLPFPLLWMQGNEMASGDPFYPIHVVEEFHRNWVSDGVGRLGEWGYRLQNLGFWPGVALFTLTPLVALFSGVGLWKAWRSHREARWLVFVTVIPAAFYTFKASVLLNFVPLGRFTVTQLAMLLPFVAVGFAALMAKRSVGAQRAVAGLASVLAVAMPVGLGVYTFRADGGPRDTLRPVSPTSTNPVPVMRAADFLKAEAAAKGGAAVIDDDPSYMDLQVAFFSGLPEMRMARVRWDTFRQRFNEARPEYVVRFEKGSLAKDAGVKLEGRTLTLDGVAFDELDGFSPAVRVYRRR
ncbi:glycosyltransferase family 39 protein [Myxococcaceae bacterium GXIMD 01537]